MKLTRTRLMLAMALGLAVGTAQAHDTGAQDGSDTDKHGGDISHVNGGITAEAGQHYGDLDTVNGGISVERGAIAGTVETVNGGVKLDDEAQVESAETVNGGITAGEHVRVAKGAETVNGGIVFDFNSTVGGDITTVNGGITIKQTQVAGKLETVSGDITVGAKSIVRGGIHVEKQHGFSWGRSRIPRIVIGPNAEVQGDLRFDREVELFVHQTAKIGRVTGATAQAWTTTLPPRRD